MEKRKIYILLGASGSGKTTLGEYLKAMGIPEVVSDTTRKMREGEIEGVHYYFVSKEEFDAVNKIEYSEYSGNFYCLSKDEVDNKLNNYGTVFAITDLPGAMQVKALYPDEVKIIYIYTPPKEMERRMKGRGDKPEDIQKRLQYAKQTEELSNYIYADYIIENKDIEDSVSRIKEIVSRDEDNEIERKFLIKKVMYNNIVLLNEMPHDKITQGYISLVPEIRVRAMGDVYYRTEKSEGTLIRKETEHEISLKKYECLSLDIKGNLIRKTRYYMLKGNHIFELDIYKDKLTGLYVVEVEFLSELESNTFKKPLWFGKEITEDKRYKNKNLSIKGKPL